MFSELFVYYPAKWFTWSCWPKHNSIACALTAFSKKKGKKKYVHVLMTFNNKTQVLVTLLGHPFHDSGSVISSISEAEVCYYCKSAASQLTFKSVWKWVFPVDKRPSNDYLHHYVKNKFTNIHLLGDSWHLTCDTWHVTYDKWHAVHRMPFYLPAYTWLFNFHRFVRPSARPFVRSSVSEIKFWSLHIH